MPSTTFLDVLDAYVRRDPGPDNVRGHVAVGLRRSPGRYQWWRAVLGGERQVGMVEARPHDADVILYIDDADAEAMLTTGALPDTPSLFRVEGDTKLLVRFSRRYLRGVSAWQTRLGVS